MEMFGSSVSLGLQVPRVASISCTLFVLHVVVPCFAFVVLTPSKLTLINQEYPTSIITFHTTLLSNRNRNLVGFPWLCESLGLLVDRRRYPSQLAADSSHDEKDNDPVDFQRRSFLMCTASILFMQKMLIGPEAVSARGLVQFPCVSGLANSYHFLRVGTTLFEDEGIWSTNPLFLTNREDALSQVGFEQIFEVCNTLSIENRAPTVVKYSLAASCIDAANIIQEKLRLGRERIIPEFTFLDPRAVGAWDMMPKSDIEPAVWALDVDEAGNDGSGGRPPPNEDGTPNETLGDQAIRLRQLLSILETQYSGDTILLIFPDGTGPALLSAMIAGIPYYQAHQLEFTPGEVRLDVTYESTNTLFKERKLSSSIYNQRIEQGRITLAALKDSEIANESLGYVNLVDQKLEKQRMEVEQAVEAKYRQQRLASLEEQNIRTQRQMQYAENNDPAASRVVGGVGAVLAAAGIGFVINRNETTGNDVVAAVQPDADSGTTEIVRVNGVIGGTSTFASLNLPLLDPKQAAEKAMQEYLEQDDGGDDWLRVLADIIQEPDESEGDFVTTMDESKEQSWNTSAFQ